MISIRSIFYVSILMFISNSLISQNNETIRDTINEKSDEEFKSNSYEFNLDNPLDAKQNNSLTAYSLVKTNKYLQRNFDKAFNKYLELDRKEMRFDLNFDKMNFYSYSSNRVDNLSSMGTGLKPYYPDPHYTPSFAEGVVSGFVQSFLLGLR